MLARLSEFARTTGLPLRALHRWARAGKLPGAVRLNNSWYVRSAEALAWIDEQETRSGYTKEKTAPSGRLRSTSEAQMLGYLPVSGEAKAFVDGLLKRRKQNAIAEKDLGWRRRRQ